MGGDIVLLSEDQNQEEEQKRSWADAPIDILSLILSKLCAGDSVAFSAVCKTWKSVPVARQTIPPPISSNDKLSTCPCLMLSNDYFFHPLYNVSFQMDSIYRLPEGIVRAAKCGWLLMARGESSVFFFNPFTNERIDLPCERFSTSPVTFSSPPTSPDCEVVYIWNDVRDMIAFATMKRGEDDFWSRHRFRGLGCFERSRCNPVFYKGVYYCVGMDGNLVIYDSKRNKHRRTGSPKHLWRHFSAPDCRHYMFEGEGDLWAVFIACQGREVCVCKLNVANMVWEMVRDLEDRMLFVSHTASFMERASVRGAGNKIYFPRFRGRNGMFYSLATKRYHSYERGTSSYNSFHNSKEMLRSTWIKIDPQPVKTCGEEFSW